MCDGSWILSPIVGSQVEYMSCTCYHLFIDRSKTFHRYVYSKVTEQINMKKAKMVLVGDAGVGKTCIAQRISKNTFTNTTAATVGAANLSVTIKTPSIEVEFNIWDTVGQERYRSLTPMYFAGSQIAILVFDLTSEISFQNLDTFVDLLQQKAPPDCILVLCGNKVDLEDKRVISHEQGQGYAERIGAIFYTETSAATGVGVVSLFENIAESGMIAFKTDDDYIADFSKQSNSNTSKKGCC